MESTMDIEHEKFIRMRHRILKRKFQVARNQARFKNQEWDIGLEDYFELWETVGADSWLFSGQGAEDYNLSRKDMDEGWTLDNVHVIPRREMLANQGRYISDRSKR